MSKDDKSTYYDAGGIETLDVIKAKLTKEQYHGHLLGNAIKYQCRMMHKPPENPQRDAEKAANYSKWLAESFSLPADNFLFLTHTPCAFKPGSVYEGRLITRLVQVGPTALVCGGSTPCWEVYGDGGAHND